MINWCFKAFYGLLRLFGRVFWPMISYLLGPFFKGYEDFKTTKKSGDLKRRYFQKYSEYRLTWNENLENETMKLKKESMKRNRAWFLFWNCQVSHVLKPFQAAVCFRDYLTGFCTFRKHLSASHFVKDFKMAKTRTNIKQFRKSINNY